MKKPGKSGFIFCDIPESLLILDLAVSSTRKKLIKGRRTQISFNLLVSVFVAADINHSYLLLITGGKNQ